MVPYVPDSTWPAAGTPDGWRAVRGLIKSKRPDLSRVAAALYPAQFRVGGTDLLARPEWVAEVPLPLDAVRLTWMADARAPVVDGLGAPSAHVRPWQVPGERYRSYAEAIGALDPPALFQDRACYRLLGARLAAPAPAAGELCGSGGASHEPCLRLTRARFFEAVSFGHALAHELAAAWMDGGGEVSLAGLPLRAAAGDPCSLHRRPAVPAVTTLTVRRAAGGQASFLLHWRDPAKVAHAGGVYQVMPAGIFQPASDRAGAERHDLSLWQAMAREFSEELLGTPEILAGGDGRLDYGAWPLYQRLTQAKAAGSLAVWCLGVGVDPLTLATDILTVAVIDAPVFDDLFAGLVAENEEGRVIGEDGSPGIGFTAASVERFSGGSEPMQPAGAALLRLAWRHRDHLLG